MQKDIGGYFCLELNDSGSVYHDEAVAVNTGRNALEYILVANNFKKIFLPFYSCDVLLQPINKLGIDVEFYHLDKYLFPKLKKLKRNEAIVYVNYFGLMSYNILKLKNVFSNLIIDNAQAFYEKPLDSISTIYSPRKFFGLPDGGFVYTKNKDSIFLSKGKSSNLFKHLLVRLEQNAKAGYNNFIKNEDKLANLPLSKMSNITLSLMKNINFELIKEKRNFNFRVLHEGLKEVNEFTPFIENSELNGPMVYPFLRKGNNNYFKKLISKNIFVARYWPNVIEWIGSSKGGFEIYLHNNLIPLPIDQRYSEDDMLHILENIEL